MGSCVTLWDINVSQHQGEYEIREHNDSRYEFLDRFRMNEFLTHDSRPVLSRL